LAFFTGILPKNTILKNQTKSILTITIENLMSFFVLAATLWFYVLLNDWTRIRLRIRIRIKVKGLIRIRIKGKDQIRIRIKVERWIRIRKKIPHPSEKADPDQHQSQKPDPDPRQGDADPQRCSLVFSTEKCNVLEL
jgi:hypothetical protein